MVQQRSHSKTKPCEKLDKKIVIITAGGLKMGLGHVYRALSLAKELSEFGKVSFLTTSGNVVIDKIKSNGYGVVRFETSNDMINWLNCDKPNIIVFDKLEVDEEFVKEIKSNLDSIPKNELIDSFVTLYLKKMELFMFIKEIF